MISNIEVAMITWPVWLLIVTILAVFFIGTFLGYFNSNTDAKKKLEEAHARTETVILQARGDAERATARVAQAEKMIASASANSSSGKTILRLWLDAAERPALDLDGQSVDTTHITETHRKRLVSLMNVMRPWIEGKSSTAPVPAAPQPVTSAPVSTPIIQVPPPAPKSIFSSLPLPTLLPGQKDEPPAVPLSIVAQIDEILQARLAIGPLADRDIKLLEAPDGSVIVQIGSQKFAGVGEVTDPEVQSVLRAAIAAWEKKYTPGM
jgi:hypothetical protein